MQDGYRLSQGVKGPTMETALIEESRPNFPERTLWVAVLDRAVRDFAGIDAKSSQVRKAVLRHDAEAWFRSESDAPGSFRWVCDQLGLDPSSFWWRLQANAPGLPMEWDRNAPLPYLFMYIQR